MIGDHITYHPAFKPLAKTLVKILLPAIREGVFGAFPARGGSGFRYSHSHTSGLESAQTRRSIPNAIFGDSNTAAAKANGKSPTKLCIAIGGESGCGKSTLAYALQVEIKNASDLEGYIFHTDDYFKLPPKDNHEARRSDINLVGPNELALSVLDENISTLKKGTGLLQKSVIDYFGNTKHNETVDCTLFSYCIVEGTYACLSNQADCILFMEFNYKDTEMHRKNRNRDTISEFNDHVLALEHEIIKTHTNLADIIIDKHLAIKNILK